jgi:DNA-binding response OmpR family regulator
MGFKKYFPPFKILNARLRLTSFKKWKYEKMACILIIDDEDMIRNLLVKIFEREGYETITASDGKEGIKRHRESPADLIITDLIMPGKEGIETIMELRRDFPAVKIIAMSGGGNIDPETYLRIAKTMGAMKTLTKPFDRKELLKTIQELLEEG